MRMAVDLVCGVDPPVVKCMALETRGLMEWSGNDDCGHWKWVREKLDGYTDEGLLELYAILRKGE